MSFREACYRALAVARFASEFTLKCTYISELCAHVSMVGVSMVGYRALVAVARFASECSVGISVNSLNTMNTLMFKCLSNCKTLHEIYQHQTKP